MLVAGEIALCFVLIFGSLLSVRSLQSALTTRLGFNPQGVSTAAYDLGLAGYSKAAGEAFQARVLEAVKQVPGVDSAAYGNSLPLSMDQSTTAVQADAELRGRGRNAKTAGFYQISPGYLPTLAIPLLRGRDFDAHDSAHTARVAIVNRTFAQTVMHTSNPVGTGFRTGLGGTRILVVGMVENGKYVSITEPPRSVVFWPIAQQYNSTTTLVVRSRQPSAQMAAQVRGVIASLDSGLPIYGTGSLVNMFGFALLPMRVAAVALSAFGLLAIVLAAPEFTG